MSARATASIPHRTAGQMAGTQGNVCVSERGGFKGAGGEVGAVFRRPFQTLADAGLAESSNPAAPWEPSRPLRLP